MVTHEAAARLYTGAPEDDLAESANTTMKVKVEYARDLPKGTKRS